MVRNHAPCLLSSLPGPLLRSRPHWLLLAPLRAATLYALRGRPFSALAGLLCGVALLPAAYLRRRTLMRSGTSAKAAGARGHAMAQADRDRLAMRAARRAGAEPRAVRFLSVATFAWPTTSAAPSA
jgi:hypothetical protein